MKFLSKKTIFIYSVFFLLGWFANTVYKDTHNSSDKNVILFNTTWDLIHSEYLGQDVLDSQKLMYGAIKGMVASVGDPFTVFLDPSEHSDFQASLTGVFEGVGIEIRVSEVGEIVIETVYENSAGYKIGLKKGDVIVSINNKASELWSLSEANKIINGKKGNVIRMNIFSPLSVNRQELEIIQDQYIPPSVKYELDLSGRIGIIKVTRFGDQTIEEWKKVVSDIDLNKPDGLVLDLRNNLGGFAEVPLFIASEFIRSGEIYKVINAQGQETLFTVNHEGQLLDIPVVVLINKKSVSATEMLAGSLKYNNRALLIGEKSFGKGTEQSIINLSDGSGLHVTTTKWFFPDGSGVDNSGLIPDYPISLTKDDKLNNNDTQLDFAIKILSQR